jgi:hypothetical protein
MKTSEEWAKKFNDECELKGSNGETLTVTWEAKDFEVKMDEEINFCNYNSRSDSWRLCNRCLYNLFIFNKKNESNYVTEKFLSDKINKLEEFLSGKFSDFET